MTDSGVPDPGVDPAPPPADLTPGRLDPDVLPPVLAPMREPKPLSMHWAVDAAVCFVALIIVLWIFFGVPLLVVVAISLIAGMFAAPLTRQIERKGLADRARQHHDAGATPPPPPTPSPPPLRPEPPSPPPGT